MNEAHENRRDDIAAYSLGALHVDEKLELERHLEDCAKCREYLLWLDPASATLGASVNQVEPPASLKRSIMGEVGKDIKQAKRVERDEARQARGLWGSIWRPVTAAALSAVLVAGAVGGYLLASGDDEQFSAPLTTTQAGVGALMSATVEHDGEVGTIHVERLPALPDDRVYQAWIERDGALEPSTPFVVKHDGGVEVALEGDLDGATAVKITREPDPGSQIPTSKVIMAAPLS